MGILWLFLLNFPYDGAPRVYSSSILSPYCYATTYRLNYVDCIFYLVRYADDIPKGGGNINRKTERKGWNVTNKIRFHSIQIHRHRKKKTAGMRSVFDSFFFFSLISTKPSASRRPVSYGKFKLKKNVFFFFFYDFFIGLSEGERSALLPTYPRPILRRVYKQCWDASR